MLQTNVLSDTCKTVPTLEYFRSTWYLKTDNCVVFHSDTNLIIGAQICVKYQLL